MKSFLESRKTIPSSIELGASFVSACFRYVMHECDATMHEIQSSMQVNQKVLLAVP